MEQKNNIQEFVLEDKVLGELKEAVLKFPPSTTPPDLEQVQALREFLKKLAAGRPVYETDKVVLSTRTIPGPKDTPDLPIRIFEPATRPEGVALPVVYWLHAGGFFAGRAEMNDNWLKKIVEEVNCVAISIGYRLSPENRYPAAIEDCYAGLLWIKDSAAELGIDPKRIVVGGHSAGGNLCAALTLLTRDRGGPEIFFQMPIYPMINDRNDTPSSLQVTDLRVWNGPSNKIAWKHYLGDMKDEEVPIYAAPSRAKDLSKLPPAYTFVGELDPFRDETIEYVQKLMQAGVAVEFHLYPGVFHGSEIFIPHAESSKKINQTTIDALRNALRH